MDDRGARGVGGGMTPSAAFVSPLGRPRALRALVAVLALLTGRWRLAHAQVYKCHKKCTKCHLFDYDGSWHCLECLEGYDLWVDGCFLPCPLGEFRFGEVCASCTANCNYCVGPMRHECTECARGYEFDMRGVCVRQCEEGFAPTLNGKDCEACNAYCRTCLSPFKISCTSCFDGYRLRILDANTSSGECMQNCPDGYYRDASDDLRCIQCGEYCLACFSAETCSECEEGATLYRGICYKQPAFLADSAIDFESYMESGAGMAVDIDDPSSPTWANLIEGSARRLQQEQAAARADANVDAVDEEDEEEEEEGVLSSL